MFAEMKAAASDNPLILKKFELEMKLKKLMVLQKSFTKNKYSIQNTISRLEEYIKISSKNLINYRKDEKSAKT